MASTEERRARLVAQFVPLIGQDAADAMLRAMRWRAWMYILGVATVVLFLTTLSVHNAAMNALVAVLWVVYAVVLLQSLRLSRQAARAASAYLAPRVGFPIRLTGTFNTTEQWQRAIERHRQRYIASGGVIAGAPPVSDRDQLTV